MTWSHTILSDPDGTFRVEITDEDGATVPVVRQVSRTQAERLIQRIATEAEETSKPIRVVIRDPYLMAATVITLRRVRE